MPPAHLITFEPTDDTCALLLVGVASAFVTVGHVQQCEKAKHTLKEFIESQKVSDVSNTSPNARIWSFLETATPCFTSYCSLILIHLAADFTG